MAVKRGGTVCKPTWAIVWGDLVTGEWIGRNGNIMKPWLEKTLKLATCGKSGAQKMGKLAGNSSFGIQSKRDFNSTVSVVKSQRELTIIMTDPNLSIKFCDRINPGTMIVRYEHQKDEEYAPSANACHLGGFVTAYAHRDIDIITETALPNRRGYEDKERDQFFNGDTDSLMMTAVQFKRIIHYCGNEIGEMGDDLEGYSKCSFVTKEKCTREECKTRLGKHCFHEFRPVKIIDAIFFAPKKYALKVLLQDGTIKEMTTKCNGIPKSGLIVKTGAELKKIKEKLGTEDEDVVRAYLKQQERYEDHVSFDHLAHCYDKNDHILCMSVNNFSKTGLKRSRDEMERGVLPGTISRVELNRRVGLNRWCGRVQCDWDRDITVPLGYERN
jgi:hypothetical protein